MHYVYIIYAAEVFLFSLSPWTCDSNRILFLSKPLDQPQLCGAYIHSLHMQGLRLIENVEHNDDDDRGSSFE